MNSEQISHRRHLIVLLIAVLLTGTAFSRLSYAQNTATYSVTFTSTWSATTHPQDFPPTPHFSGLIGATHNMDTTLWIPGGLASNGIEQMAETGSKTGLSNEIGSLITNGAAGVVLSGNGIPSSPGVTDLDFSIDLLHPHVTLVSMLAPSPDWFAGVHNVSLLDDNGRWKQRVEISVDPYDAGTDGGRTYRAPNSNTNPPQPIRNLRGEFPFANTSVGTFTFIRTDVPVPQIVVSDKFVSESAGTALVLMTLSTPATDPVRVRVQTINESAVAGDDYVRFNEVVTFNPGDSVKSIMISLIDDNDIEEQEQFIVQLSQPSGASILSPMSTVTIDDNDVSNAAFPRIVTTPDREPAGNYGWIEFEDRTKQWLDATCRTRLRNAGFTLMTRNWLQIATLTDRVAVSCDVLVDSENNGGETSTPYLLVTPDKAASGNYAWVALANGDKQWVSSDCRAQLEGQGLQVQISDWPTISQFPDSQTLLSCRDLGDDNNGSGSSMPRIVATPDRVATTNYGWVDFADSTKQWITANCRQQLAAAGMSEHALDWNEIATLTDRTDLLSCDDIEALIAR